MPTSMSCGTISSRKISFLHMLNMSLFRCRKRVLKWLMVNLCASYNLLSDPTWSKLLLTIFILRNINGCHKGHRQSRRWQRHYPDRKVHWAHMGSTWGRRDPGGPRVGHLNLVIWVGKGGIYTVHCNATVLQQILCLESSVICAITMADT